MVRWNSLKVLMVAMFVSGCGVQAIPQARNKTEASLAEVTNQYKRRSDLIPNLVATVKAYAAHEKSTLEGVIAARAKATAITLDASTADPQQLAAYQEAQGGLSQALGRLMVVSERYPELKADRNFSELRAQLEGTENRITIARQRYIETIREFNDLVSVPPTSWVNSLIYRYPPMPQWALAPEEQQNIDKAPKVEF